MKVYKEVKECNICVYAGCVIGQWQIQVFEVRVDVASGYALHQHQVHQYHKRCFCL